MKQAQFPKQLTIALQSDVYRRIKELSDERSISMGEVVRGIIENNEKPNKTKENKNG